MTDTGDVIDSYLVWELCKEKDIQRKIMEGSADGSELKELIEKVRHDYREERYDRSEKEDKILELGSNPEYRCKMFERCSWSKETVRVDDLGTTLPRCAGLPPEVITGRLEDVLKFVKQANPGKYQSIEYINSLKEVPEVLNEFSTIVISPGNTIRELERMNNVHGEKNWDIKETWGAVHDANHRTMAKILANDLDKINCYVGRPQNIDS